MTKQRTPLFVALAAALLLSGCGKSPTNAPAAQLFATHPAAQATQATHPNFGRHLVIESASVRIETQGASAGRQQVFCLAGTCDGAPFSLSTSTFFPYYVPMFGSVNVNGQDIKLTRENAKALVKLINAADTQLINKADLGMLLYGLNFKAGL